MNTRTEVPPPLVEVRGLSVAYPAAGGMVRVVRDVSIRIDAGETLALVGESGSGKTTVALALAGLLDSTAHLDGGEILLDGIDLRGASPETLRGIRGKAVGMVFQDSRASLNPVLTVEEHLLESLRAHARPGRSEARLRVVDLLREVGLPDPEGARRRYPSELSGGMCQRVAIALALCHHPRLVVADEPTSALDPTIAHQVLELLAAMRDRHGLALLLITHELPLVALADRVAVMYAGRVVESGPARETLRAPAHPYTAALIAAATDARRPAAGRRLPSIPGTPPPPGAVPDGCAFAPRCPHVETDCRRRVPAPVALPAGGWAACIRAGRDSHDAATR